MAIHKIILLTKHKRLYKSLRQTIKQKKLECETDITSLCDVDHIIKMIRITKNTLFIRDAYSDFIKKNNGTPLCIILDYKIDLGLSADLDPDKMKLIRTFLIASVILNNMTGLQYNMTNIILIGSPVHLKQFELFKSNPNLIFTVIKTSNPKLNQLLDKTINNSEVARSLFYFNYLLIDEANDVISPARKLEIIIDKILVKKQSIINKEKTKHQTGLISGHYVPAKILYKISGVKLYLDGKLYDIENNHEFNKYENNVIYIIGHYVHNNVNEVNKKIEKFILDYLPKLRTLSLNTEINISLNSHTIIDGGITPALNILLSTKLKDFKNIRLITSPENFVKMEKSPGFISLKNYIFKKL